ncbi:hypothetical protein RDI58_027161 [Solanum bulbocastanum]|uniref:Uncharacterized protein n=1 Tax=Solanum bulbocastanum TaxID=147425 RepID=A0AAN8SX82_SOLBU
MGDNRRCLCSHGISGYVTVRASSSSAHFQNNVRSIALTEFIELFFANRYRRIRGLAVTDINAAEWCEKKMEYTLLCGKPEKTKAMKAGSSRHEALKEEVIKKVKVRVDSAEDVWALKFFNFIVGANPLLFDGLTRELPLFC